MAFVRALVSSGRTKRIQNPPCPFPLVRSSSIVLFSDPAPVHACSASLCRRRTRRQRSWILHCMGSEHCLLLPWCELSFCYSVPEDCNACVDFLPGTASALIHPTAPPTSTVASQSELYEYDSVLSWNVEILFQNLRIVMPKARV